MQRLKDKGFAYDHDGAVKFKMERDPIVIPDLVVGNVKRELTDRERLDPDFVIVRSDGQPVFHFVNVVDDLEMGITHVIRGEDHLTNTAKHIALFRAFGVEPPKYAHIPLILNIDGTKMSKRDQGASLTTYMEEGYAPEAVVNYLCLLGWSPKENREKLTIEEVTRLFEPGKINRKAAQFDIDKCRWLNWQYLVAMDLDHFADGAIPYVEAAGIRYGSRSTLLPVLALIKEKIKQLPDVPAWIDYFFTDDYPYDAEAVEKTLRKPGALIRLAQLGDAYSELETWDAATLEAKLKETAASLGCKPAELIHPARVAVSGRAIGPSLYHMLEVLGKKRLVLRAPVQAQHDHRSPSQ